MAGRPDLTTFTAPFTVVSFMFLMRRFVPTAVRCRPSLAMHPSFIDPSASLKDGTLSIYVTPIREASPFGVSFAAVTRSFLLGLSLRRGMLALHTSLATRTRSLAERTTSRYDASNRTPSMLWLSQSFVPAHTMILP